MATDPTIRAIESLTSGDPSYDDLHDIYDELRAASAETAHQRICHRAVAQVVGEFLDYLDFVAADLEKSLGITRSQERERVLASFQVSAAEDHVERVAAVIEQWESIERYSPEEIRTLVRQPSAGSETLDNRIVEFNQ